MSSVNESGSQSFISFMLRGTSRPFTEYPKKAVTQTAENYSNEFKAQVGPLYKNLISHAKKARITGVLLGAASAVIAFTAAPILVKGSLVVLTGLVFYRAIQAQNQLTGYFGLWKEANAAATKENPAAAAAAAEAAATVSRRTGAAAARAAQIIRDEDLREAAAAAARADAPAPAADSSGLGRMGATDSGASDAAATEDSASDADGSEGYFTGDEAAAAAASVGAAPGTPAPTPPDGV